MSDGEQKPLTPKDGCKECQELHDGEGEVHASVQILRDQRERISAREITLLGNTRRSASKWKALTTTYALLAQKLRIHEITCSGAREGIQIQTSPEFRDSMNIVIRNGRDRA